MENVIYAIAVLCDTNKGLRPQTIIGRRLNTLDVIGYHHIIISTIYKSFELHATVSDFPPIDRRVCLYSKSIHLFKFFFYMSI